MRQDEEEYWKNAGAFVNKIAALSDSDFAMGRVDYDDQIMKILDEAAKEFPANMAHEEWYVENHPKSQRARVLKWFKKWHGLCH